MKFANRALVLGLLAFAGWPSPASSVEDKLAIVSPLVGDWTGVSEGEPGKAATTRHGERVQNNRYIMVQGRSVYPKQEANKSGEVHTQIDFWSFDRQRSLIVLRQFDSLGFVSTYVQDRAASTKGRIVLVSEHLENVPVGLKARYTYEFRAPNEYHELFELDENGKGFKTYVAGDFLRDGPAPGKAVQLTAAGKP